MASEPTRDADGVRCEKCHGTGFILVDDGFVHEYQCPDCAARDADAVVAHHPDCEGWMRDWRERAHAAEAENERLRAEIKRHGWTLDCGRCAELIDGSIADD